MASISTISISSPTTAVTQQKPLPATGHRPMSFSDRNPRKSTRRLEARASANMREKVASLATAAVLVVPEVAEAAGPGVSPSLKNFLLSIVAGGAVAAVIVGAVIGVANFDPVKRR